MVEEKRKEEEESAVLEATLAQLKFSMGALFDHSMSTSQQASHQLVSL